MLKTRREWPFFVRIKALFFLLIPTMIILGEGGNKAFCVNMRRLPSTTDMATT
jgi:hypothetical protein